jgi:DNA-binding ferritin-like protein
LVRQQTQAQIDASDIAHRQEMMATRKDNAALVVKKNDQIKELQGQVGGMHEMFFEMLQEMANIQKGTKDDRRKLSSLEALAHSRQTRLKESRVHLSNLRDAIEADTDCYLQIISEAHSHIAYLQEQVNDMEEVCQEQQLAIDLAIEDLDASDCF